MLKWENKEGSLLTETAVINTTEYMVFFGCFQSETWNARITDITTGKRIAEYSNGNPNFGKQSCIKWCETHAKKNNQIIKRIILKVKNVFRRAA